MFRQIDVRPHTDSVYQFERIWEHQDSPFL